MDAIRLVLESQQQGIQPAFIEGLPDGSRCFGAWGDREAQHTSCPHRASNLMIHAGAQARNRRFSFDISFSLTALLSDRGFTYASLSPADFTTPVAPASAHCSTFYFHLPSPSLHYLSPGLFRTGPYPPTLAIFQAVFYHTIKVSFSKCKSDSPCLKL